MTLCLTPGENWLPVEKKSYGPETLDLALDLSAWLFYRALGGRWDPVCLLYFVSWRSGLVAPRHMDLPRSGIKSKSPAWAGGFFAIEPPGKPQALYFGSRLHIVSFCLPKCEMVASFEISFANSFDDLKKSYGTSLWSSGCLHCRHGFDLWSGN